MAVVELVSLPVFVALYNVRAAWGEDEVKMVVEETHRFAQEVRHRVRGRPVPGQELGRGGRRDERFGEAERPVQEDRPAQTQELVNRLDIHDPQDCFVVREGQVEAVEHAGRVEQQP